MATCVVVPFGPAAVDITGVRAGDRNLMTLSMHTDDVPTDLTGLTVAAQARLTPTSEEALSAVCEITDAPAGLITVRWPGEDVAAMLGEANVWKGVWDLQVSSGGEDGEVVTVVAGRFSAQMDVTR